jgi:hypothetical protein
MSRNTQWGSQTGSQNAEKASMGLQNWVSECRESHNGVSTVDFGMTIGSQPEFKTRSQSQLNSSLPRIIFNGKELAVTETQSYLYQYQDSLIRRQPLKP